MPRSIGRRDLSVPNTSKHPHINNVACCCYISTVDNQALHFSWGAGTKERRLQDQALKRTPSTRHHLAINLHRLHAFLGFRSTPNSQETDGSIHPESKENSCGSAQAFA